MQTRTYAYVPGKFSITGSSSGILLKTRPVDATDSRYPVLLTPVWNKNYNIDEPYIGYSHVVETFGDGGYTQYSFSDYVSCPDNAGVNYRWLSGAGPSNPLVFAFSHATLAASSWDKRGLLVKKQAYDARNNLCLLQEYNYENAGTFLTPMPPAGQREEPYAVCFRSLDGGGMAMKLYMQDHPVVREKETEYGDGEGYLYTLTEHAYNADGFLERTDESTSDGDTLRTEYAYPSDSKYPQLLPLNVKGRVVEKRQYRSGQLLWTEEYRPKVLKGGGVVTGSTWRRKGKGSSSWQTQCYQHDGYGNPVDIREREGVDRIVIWGYAGRYPVAEITGASYEEVKEALGGTAPESLSSAAAPDMARLDALRSALPQALVTTYTHKPLVGVASVTDANGTTTTYTYNGKGELVRAADDDGRTVTEYEKHYRK